MNKEKVRGKQDKKKKGSQKKRLLWQTSKMRLEEAKREVMRQRFVFTFSGVDSSR